MKIILITVFIIIAPYLKVTSANTVTDTITIFNTPLHISIEPSFIFQFTTKPSGNTVEDFYDRLSATNYQPLIKTIQDYKTEQQLNDWLFYQTVRAVAEKISPKKENYLRYTLFKWFLLNKSGYDARLASRDDQIIMYVRTNDDISDLPFFNLGDNTFVCLNYHDYNELFKINEPYSLINFEIPEAKNAFSYKITNIPTLKADKYEEKKVAFNYKGKTYKFNLQVNQDINTLFKNYPIVDFETYFNIPMSEQTYQSLIPQLVEKVGNLSVEKGVDYLMRFTRKAFLYEDDWVTFGKEKRFSPEATLSAEASDCDDRAALFFYLVKEIYNLPMITLRYPTHVTMAIQFDKPIGQSIFYEGQYFTVCEPTPQAENLNIGQLSKQHKNQLYEVVYHYVP